MRWAAPSRQARRQRFLRSSSCSLRFLRRAGAQSAWLPFAGEASVSLTFQSLNYGGHFDETGAKREGVGATQSYYGIVQFEYGLTDQVRGERAAAVHHLEIHR